VRERLTWFTYGGFHLTGGLFPRCQREQLGGAGGIRARFTGPVLAKLARCHARHARCTPRFWTDAWEVQIKPDGSVSGVRHRKAGGPAGLARCVEPVLRAMSWASCGTPTTMQLDFAALRSRSSPACQR
jgi:hypothetical protein